jgi:hypothetical protein
MSSLPHLSTEFFTWLWYASEQGGGQLVVDGEEIIIWVDDRLAFHTPAEHSARAVLTGADTAQAAEAKAALAGGKVIREVRLRIQWADREYGLTLRGDSIDLAGLVLPPLVVDGGDEADRLYARMESVEALWAVLGALYRDFATIRTSERWTEDLVPGVQRWLVGGA